MDTRNWIISVAFWGYFHCDSAMDLRATHNTTKNQTIRWERLNCKTILTRSGQPEKYFVTIWSTEVAPLLPGPRIEPNWQSVFRSLAWNLRKKFFRKGMVWQTVPLRNTVSKHWPWILISDVINLKNEKRSDAALLEQDFRLAAPSFSCRLVRFSFVSLLRPRQQSSA